MLHQSLQIIIASKESASAMATNVCERHMKEAIARSIVIANFIFAMLISESFNQSELGQLDACLLKHQIAEDNTHVIVTTNTDSNHIWKENAKNAHEGGLRQRSSAICSPMGLCD